MTTPTGVLDDASVVRALLALPYPFHETNRLLATDAVKGATWIVLIRGRFLASANSRFSVCQYAAPRMITWGSFHLRL